MSADLANSSGASGASGDAALARQLRRVRRRILTVGGCAGACWGLAVATLTLLAAIWLDLVFDVPPVARVTLAVLALVVGLVSLLTLWRSSARRGRGVELARVADRAAAADGQIVSGWDLSRRLEARSPLSAGLASMAVDQAADLSHAARGSAVAPWRVLQSPLALLSAAAIVVAAAVALRPELAWTQWQRFVRPWDNAPPFSLVKLTVEPGDVSVVYGDGLDIYVTTSGPPVDEVELILRPHSADGTPREAVETLPLFREESGRWRAALTNVTQEAEYEIRAADARSARYRILVVTWPRLLDVRVRVEPPSYTRLPPFDGAVPQGGVACLPGAKATFRARSNRPLSGGTLALAGATEPLALAPVAAEASEAEVAFTVSAGGKFELSVTDVAGQASREKFAGVITLLEDQRPFLRFLSPPTQSLATPESRLPLEIDAEDDYGLSAVKIFRSLNDSRPMPVELDLGSVPQRRWRGTAELPLYEYGLVPGDVIKIFARVEDNDPAGPKGFETGVLTVRIISQEQFERMFRARQNLEMLLSRYREAQRRMESLAERKRGLQKKTKERPPEEQAGEDAAQELADLAEQLDRDLEALRQLGDNPLPYDIDQALTPQLKRLQKRLDKQSREIDRLRRLQKEGKLSNAELDAALKDLLAASEQGDLDFAAEAMEPLEHLEKIFPLIAAESKFIAIARQQRDLAERLATIRNREGVDDPAAKARMRDFEAEQARLIQELAELLDDIENHAARLPEEEELAELRVSALEFVKSVRESGAPEAMGEAELALVGFRGTKAHEEADRAAKQLEELIAKCAGGMGQQCKGGLRFQPKLGQSLGDTIEQLLGDMGLGTGSGQGAGSGFGVRGPGEKMGLFGRHPSAAAQPTGSGRGPKGDGAASLRAGAGSADDPGTTLRSTQEVGSGAAGEATVPTQYLRRVGAYFQRIAEEIGGE